MDPHGTQDGKAESGGANEAARCLESTAPPDMPSVPEPLRPPPPIPDHTLIRRIGGGSYGEVWLARNVVGTYRAVKIVWRARFDNDRPYEREFTGICRFEPISRTHEGLVQVLQIGRNDADGHFH